MRSLCLALSLLCAATAAADLTHDLFRAPIMGRVALNPSGTMIAIESHQPDGTDERVVLVRTTEERDDSNPLVFSTGEIYFAWVDEDTLIVTLADQQGVRRQIFDLEPGKYLVSARQRDVRAVGWLVDALPLEADVVLWADWNGSESRVFRAPTDELAEPTGKPWEIPGSGRRHPYVRFEPEMATPPAERHRVAALKGRVLYWISDERGVPRAALVLEDTDPALFELRYRSGADGDWRVVGSWGQGDDVATPMGLTPDGRDLLVSSAEGRDTAALRRYLVEEERLGEVLFADPEFDVQGVLFAYQGYEAIAAFYDEAGVRRYHYFDSAESELHDWLKESYPGKAIHVTSRTRDGSAWTVLLTGTRMPGRHYLVEAHPRKKTFLGDVMPWIQESELAKVSAFEITSKDGLSIEAFLALPMEPGDAPPPLVVMPHGGPIGVSDRRDFDPILQSLASEGFAVLQVNYRGSGGRGVAFLEAGKRSWAREIEDDIEAAIEHVVDEGLVDSKRICLFGISYGGYSALTGVIRHPLRYQCAAAVAAPSDLLLLFDSSDFAATEQGRAAFAEVVGDPDLDREHLISISPAYRAAEIRVPVLLAHGDSDRRVDTEHAYRMKAMLEAYGKEFEWMLLEDTAHSPTRGEMSRIVRALHAFLARHLAADARAP